MASDSPNDPDVTLLEVGHIAKAHGLRGEVIVELVTDRMERVAPGTVLTSERGPLRIERSSPHQHRWIVAFAGVTDRTQAEGMRGLVLCATPFYDPDALWVHELIGAEVCDRDGALLGRVTAVEANPASDLLVLDGGGLVPLRFVVDHRPGTVTVDAPPGLLD